MTTIQKSRFLRNVLLLDAAASGATGLILLLAAGPLAGWLALPEPLVRYAGLALLPFALVVALVALRDTAPRVAVWAVIAANALWALDSVILLFTGWVEPTAFGYAFVLGQAVIVAAFAELQYLGMRRGPTAA